MQGCSLHAAVRCGADDRQAKGQLCRYITRPVLANDRVHRAFSGASPTTMDARRCRWQSPWESIDVDRSRKVSVGRIGRKPAPMLVLSTLTVKVTVKVCEAAASTLQINSLEGSLMIEWE